jgi:uncharacterized protein
MDILGDGRKMSSQQEIRRTLRRYAGDILESESFQHSKEFVQHGSFSVWKHSMNVAKVSLQISQMLPFQFSEKELVRGALLHDYFQYDWHKRRVGMKELRKFHQMHGFIHPEIAAQNAKRDFRIGKLENEIIRKHMWPLTITELPMCREAWVVTMADKYCSLLETMHMLKGDLCG